MNLPIDGQTQDASPEQPKGSSETPLWFQEFVGQIDKRFEGVSDKIGQLSVSPPADSPKRAAKQAKISEDKDVPDFGFADGIKFGELRVKLTDAARERVDSIAESDPAKALEMAELISLMAPANGDMTAATPPPGKAASAAPNNSPSHPETVTDYLGLTSEQRKVLLKDPAFDPELLKPR